MFKGESLLEMHNKLLFYIFWSDPYLGDKDGKLTWGATINHSRNNENLKPFVAGKNFDRPRVFLVAVHDIPETVEFLNLELQLHRLGMSRRQPNSAIGKLRFYSQLFSCLITAMISSFVFSEFVVERNVKKGTVINHIQLRF